MERRATWNGCEIYLHQGDIAALEVDVIVNAANAELWPGGGVCGAIHRKGGRAIAEECAVLRAGKGTVPVGQAVITTGGNLHALHVIHAVGPVYDDYSPKQAAQLLAHAYRRCLEIARRHRLRTIAVPCISTGVYGYPPEQACPVAIGAVYEDVTKTNGLDQVIFCTFLESDFELYEAELAARASANQ
jgi:O-acetyl-ADP-ribose deacetylase (regulator of RNase III)